MHEAPFFSCRGNKRKKKLRKRLIFQLDVQRVAPLLGMNANAFCLFECLQPWECRLLHIIWRLLLPVCLTPETTTAAAERRSGCGWRGEGMGRGGAGDCSCHSYLHCLKDNEWHLLKCHDMTQTKKKNIFWKGKNKIHFFFGGGGGCCAPRITFANNCSV